jgi:drug/metabolite transporter (DMT)-like permease
MWSSAFSSARMIVADAPPLTALTIRFLISGVLGVMIARAMGQTWRLTRPQWLAVVVFGVCQNALYLGLNFVAMQWVEASLASIIASTMPLMVAGIGWAAWGDRVGRLGLAGLVAGFVGVALIMGTRLSGGADAAGVALCVLGALALSVATLAVRSTGSGGNVLMIVGLQMFVGSAVLAVFAVALESWEVTWTLRLGLAFAYTTLVPGLLATLVWFLLVNRIGAIKAATFHFLNPFFGVAIAAAILGEGLGPWDIVGVVIVAAGILAVQLSKQSLAAK